MKGSTGPQANDEADKFLWDVHKYTNDYIRFADTKAAFTAGVSTALIGAMVSSSVFDSSFRVTPGQWTTVLWIAFFGLLLLVTSLGLSIAAIRPRLWNNKSVGYIFWGSISGHGTAREFTHAVHSLSDRQRSEAVSEHLYVLAST